MVAIETAYASSRACLNFLSRITGTRTLAIRPPCTLHDMFDIFDKHNKLGFWCQSYSDDDEDGIRDGHVTGVQTCALPIFKEREERVQRRQLQLHEPRQSPFVNNQDNHLDRKSVV